MYCRSVYPIVFFHFFQQPRNLMTLNEYDSQKYLDEVQDAKNFHSLITEIKFGLNTVIAVTDEQSRQLSNYFK